jgi:pimeloyl-ACP methyl ester carboxylesterase
MLLLHGMRDLAWSLDPLALHFRERFRVVSLDLRGHGDSDQVGYYALPHFVIDLREAIRQLGLEHPVLVGHSFGGKVVSHFAALFPEAARALVLVEGLISPPWEAAETREAALAELRAAVESLDRAGSSGHRVPSLEAASQKLREGHPRLDPGRARFLAEVGTRPHPDGGLAWKWDPLLQTIWGTFNLQMVETAWEQIRCPVLVLEGANAPLRRWRELGGARLRRVTNHESAQSEERGRLLSLFPDAEFKEIPGAGHMIHFDEPERLNSAIERFLRSRGIDTETGTSQLDRSADRQRGGMQ